MYINFTQLGDKLMSKKKIILIALLLLLTLAGNIHSFPEDEDIYYPVTDRLVLAKLSQWQDLKFGLLMHWGPYSQWGVVESWSICSEDEDWCRRNMDGTAVRGFA